MSWVTAACWPGWCREAVVTKGMGRDRPGDRYDGPEVGVPGGTVTFQVGCRGRTVPKPKTSGRTGTPSMTRSSPTAAGSWTSRTGSARWPNWTRRAHAPPAWAGADSTQWWISTVDTASGQLLDIVQGREAGAAVRWLAVRSQAWRTPDSPVSSRGCVLSNPSLLQGQSQSPGERLDEPPR